jgi:hypothetical protein
MSSSKFKTLLLTGALLAGSIAIGQTDSQVSEQPEVGSSNSYAGLWMLGLLMQSDDESSQGSAVSFGYGVGESTWFSALLANSSSPAERADISANTFVLGIDHRFDKVGFSFELEDWGESGAVESEDIGASVYFFGDRYRVELGLEKRDIDFTFSLPFGDRIFTRKASFDADGWSFGVNVRASDAVSVYYDYRDYDYSVNLRVLPRIDRLNLLNGSALTLANSLLSEVHTFGVDVAFGDKSLSLIFGEDTSAIDGTDLSSIGASLIFPVAPRIDLEISLGRSDSDFLEASNYGGIGILIYGG